MKDFSRAHINLLLERLSEEPRWLIVITGPRQTGKTTLVQQALARIGCPSRYVSVDEPRGTSLGIDAQGEGTYADDKRADIRVTYGGFNIPVEIKRSCHPDLWSAIKGQLIDKYTRDPGADGHGIYVVFWYGDSEHCRPTPGVRGVPNNAADVEHSLLDDLSAEDRRKISVCLIDVAKHRG